MLYCHDSDFTSRCLRHVQCKKMCAVITVHHVLTPKMPKHTHKKRGLVVISSEQIPPNMF